MKLYFIILATFLALQAQAQVEPSALLGTWQVEGRQSFEAWSKDGKALSGESYKMVDGAKRVSETLAIKQVKSDWVYEATVPNQNAGATIPFTLNKSEKEMLSFENPKHDFPVKIQYKFESESRVFVKVLGADGKGFSYYMTKQ